MKCKWIGIALLAVSWLFGLTYYHQVNWMVWSILIVAGTLSLSGTIHRLPGRLEAGIAVIMLIPGLWFVPSPYRVAPLLMVTGLVIGVLPIPRNWPKHISSAFLSSGIVLLVQSLAMLIYESITSRSHELPWPVPQLLGIVASFLGIEATFDGSNIALLSMRTVHFLGATWELFLDPPTFCYLIGGILLVALEVWSNIPYKKRKGLLVSATSKLIGFVILWLPIRAGLLMALYMHRTLRTDYDAPLKLMNQFWSPWMHMILLAVPVLFAWRFIRLPYSKEFNPSPSTWRCKHLIPIVLIWVSILISSTGILWDPVGQRKAGRVFVDEYHSTWEPTTKSFDTRWYGQLSSYNYACIYDYCSRFYKMSRLITPIDDVALRNCDLLIIKVPTSPYKPEEIEAIRHFVKTGGGLMLIGEHTNVYKTGSYLNSIARTFGFTFRYDCLFGIDSAFTQLYHPPLVPHPIVCHMVDMDFAVSCSIDPGKSSGRAVIRSTGLWNLPADYHASNFYPQVEERADARYGAFIQLWTTRYGKGSIVAFTDSTIFSNFCTFEPGKSELMLNMIEWLNHTHLLWDPRSWLILVGLLLFGGGVILSRRYSNSWLLLLAAGVLGWTIAVIGIRAIHPWSMPAPQRIRPMVQVVIDRTICDAPLSKGGFIEGTEKGFGIFEQWILRLGYFISRRSGDSIFEGNLIVFFHPNQEVNHEFRDRLAHYVSWGGKVLILDSPENTNSTANSLLYPFDLTVDRSSNERGELSTPDGWPSVDVHSACKIRGGQPLIRLNGTPVATSVRYGNGLVMVIGFGSQFTDRYMGVTDDVIPDANLQKVFELEFSILQTIIEDKVFIQPTANTN